MKKIKERMNENYKPLYEPPDYKKEDNPPKGGFIYTLAPCFAIIVFVIILLIIAGVEFVYVIEDGVYNRS